MKSFIEFMKGGISATRASIIQPNLTILDVTERYKESFGYIGQPLVYFIRGGGLIKIGHANNLGERLRSIQMMSPVIIEYLGCVLGGETLEREIHRKFKHLRKHGEWFKPDAELINYISDLFEKEFIKRSPRLFTDNEH